MDPKQGALAQRIRDALSDKRSVREVAMFGGRAFMVNGKLAVSANAHGELLVRCDPGQSDELVERTGVRWAEMSGKRMGKGWIQVGAAAIERDEGLHTWIQAALQYNQQITSQSGTGGAVGQDRTGATRRGLP